MTSLSSSTFVIRLVPRLRSHLQSQTTWLESSELEGAAAGRPRRRFGAAKRERRFWENEHPKYRFWSRYVNVLSILKGSQIRYSLLCLLCYQGCGPTVHTRTLMKLATSCNWRNRLAETNAPFLRSVESIIRIPCCI